MSNAIARVERAVRFGEPRLVKTKQGDRNLRVASMTSAFWDVWKEHKLELKAAGYSCKKDEEKNEWSVLHWGLVPEVNEALEQLPLEDDDIPF